MKDIDFEALKKAIDVVALKHKDKARVSSVRNNLMFNYVEKRGEFEARLMCEAIRCVGAFDNATDAANYAIEAVGVVMEHYDRRGIRRIVEGYGELDTWLYADDIPDGKAGVQ